MSEAHYMTFMTGGLLLLAVSAMMIAWQLWLQRDDRRDGAKIALEGVGHELRINLHRMATEISQVAQVPDLGPETLLPIKHPQLDGVNGSMIRANRNGLAVVGATYLELESRKAILRDGLAKGRDVTPILDDAMLATIDGTAALYMWEMHNGIRPSDAGKVRSWDVRDWMKGHGFHSAMLPGIHFRDEVVERLRQYGLRLTPRPLTHTAHEYYSMRYDRHADVRGPFGKRDFEKDEREEKKKADRAARKAKREEAKRDKRKEREADIEQMEAEVAAIEKNGAADQALTAGAAVAAGAVAATGTNGASSDVPLSERPLGELSDEELEMALMEEGLETEP